MPLRHLLLSLIVVIVWGLNFIFVEWALQDISPFLLCTLRFLLASLPIVFFIKPPQVPWRYLIAYGLMNFAVQFTLLFSGMYAGISPGLASILMQVQVFFSIFFAILFLKEMPNIWQIVGAFVSFAGIAIVGIHIEKSISLLGFFLIIMSAASWGLGNLISKRIGKVNIMSLVAWGSFIAAFPLIIITLIIDKPAATLSSLQHMSLLGIISILYITYFSTWVAYGIWNWLLNRYDVSTVVPFTLLVPIVALLSSVLLLHEAFQTWKLIAGILVISGLCINLLAVRLLKKPSFVSNKDKDLSPDKENTSIQSELSSH